MLVRAAAGKVRAQSRSKFDIEDNNGEHGTGCLSSSAGISSREGRWVPGQF